jgi:hypothetical protein
LGALTRKDIEDAIRHGADEAEAHQIVIDSITTSDTAELRELPHGWGNEQFLDEMTVAMLTGDTERERELQAAHEVERNEYIRRSRLRRATRARVALVLACTRRNVVMPPRMTPRPRGAGRPRARALSRTSSRSADSGCADPGCDEPGEKPGQPIARLPLVVTESSPSFSRSQHARASQWHRGVPPWRSMTLAAAPTTRSVQLSVGGGRVNPEGLFERHQTRAARGEKNPVTGGRV